MSENFNLSQFQSAVNYSFKDEKIAFTVFSHASRSVYGEETNERLIFVGKRLFELLIADYIYSRAPFTKSAELEKKLGEYKALNIPADFVKSRSLDKFLSVSELADPFEDKNVRFSEIFFAIIGAIYRDGGMPSLKGFLLPLLRNLDSADASRGNENNTRREQTVAFSSENEQSVKQARQKKTSIEDFSGFSKSSAIDDAPADISDSTEKRSFIRDALAPVRLPDSMRTQPKKSFEQKKKHRQDNEITPEFDTTEGENYKSMLQELIQKNTRSSSVLMKYETSFSRNGDAVTEIRLEGELLASASGENKKMSERIAAKTAYMALTDRESEAFKVFSKFCPSEIDIPERREDYISKLNQHFQRQDRISTAPLTYERRYSTEKRTFCVALIHNDEEIASAKGPTLKEAKQAAAKKALEALGLI